MARIGVGSIAGWLAIAGCGRTGMYPGENADGAEQGGGSGSSFGLSHGESTVGSSSTGVDDNCDPITGKCLIELKLRRAVDILFVVDNSGSMGGEQSTLVQSFRSFVDVLEAQQVGANYRIGVTTTDGYGQLRVSSCRSRLDEFLFEWQFGSHDERQRGCLDHCAVDVITTPQPWLERSELGTNLPAGIDMATAFQCIGPQGINGPGFERPLEGMLRVLEDNPSGFLRDEAMLAVIFLTDEADCSASDDEIYWLQNYGTPFWETPDRSTSASCWNAGVECFGGPGVYDDCAAVDKDQDGLVTDDPSQAVLYPAQRYVDALLELSAQRQAAGGQGQVLLSLIAGVPLDYPETHVELYADSQFSDFNAEYGIGPACNVGTENINDPPGIPDVRMRGVVEAFATDDPNVFSVCSTDYGVALDSIAAAIGDISERACVGGCVTDLDPLAKGLQPDCRLIEQFPPDAGLSPRLLEPCIITGDTWEFPGPNRNACYRVLDDPGALTPTPVDDMAMHCVTRGFNVELVVERREGVAIPSGTAVAVDCSLVAPAGTRCEDV